MHWCFNLGVIKWFLMRDCAPVFVNRPVCVRLLPISHYLVDTRDQMMKHCRVVNPEFCSSCVHCSCPLSLCPLAIILWTRWSSESQLIQNLVSAVSISQLSDPAGPPAGPHFKTKISRFIATHYRQQPPGLVLIEVFGHQVWLASCNLYLQLATNLHCNSILSKVL